MQARVRMIAAAAGVSLLLSCQSAGSDQLGLADGEQLATCGLLPEGKELPGGEASFALEAPSSGVSGDTVTYSLRLVGVEDAAGVEVVGSSPDVLITRQGQVVGRSPEGLGTAMAFRYSLDERESDFSPTEDLLLSGCPDEDVDPTAPQSSRAPLPEGEYDLTAVVRDAESSGVYLSETRRITVTSP